MSYKAAHTLCHIALRLSIAGVLATSAISLYAQCPPLGTFTPTTDNLTNNASPYVYLLGSSRGIAYEDHNTGNLAVDPNPPSHGAVTSIGISHTTYGLGDVTAAVVSGTLYIDFLSSSNTLQLVTSSNGVNFGTPFNMNIANLNPNFTPGLGSYYGQLFAAFVSSVNQGVYLAEYNGSTWTTLGEVSSVAGVSRPYLAVFGNNLYVAYTTTNGYPVTGQVEASNTYSPNVTQQSIGRFGYKNAHGVWAGVALVPYNGNLYMIGQSVASSQYLFGAESSNGLSYGTAVQCSPNTQLRWTPSAVQLPNGQPYIAFQDPGDTFISTNNP